MPILLPVCYLAFSCISSWFSLQQTAAQPLPFHGRSVTGTSVNLRGGINSLVPPSDPSLLPCPLEPPPQITDENCFDKSCKVINFYTCVWRSPFIGVACIVLLFEKVPSGGYHGKKTESANKGCSLLIYDQPPHRDVCSIFSSYKTDLTMLLGEKNMRWKHIA